MVELISSAPVSKISIDTAIELDSKLPDTQLDVTKAITVEVQPENYVLTSGGIYTGSMTGAVPTWILNAVQQQLTTGDGNLMSVLDDMKALLGSLQLGVNQTISQIENTNTSMSALETSLSSRIQGNEAAILDVYATKVTPTEAQAIAVQAIGLTFNGNVDAYIGNLASVYTNATSAIATDIHTLQVSYNDQTARIDTVEEVTISQGTAMSILDTSVSSIINTRLPELQSQIDGVINTWFYDEVPTLLNVPTSTWLDDTTKLAHVGDLYYDKITGYGYRFAYEDIVDDPDMGIIFSWVIISDVDVVKALADAAKAQDTVDGKRTIYGGATIPLPSRVNGSATIYVAEGDIWIPSANVASYVAGEVYRCTNPSSTPTVWVLATRYTQYVTDWITNTYAPAVSSIQIQIDKKAEIFYQSTSPRISYTNIPDNVTYNSYVGDLWKDTSSGGGHLEYIYTKTVNGGNFNYGWVETAIPDIIFDTIDGKASMYTTASLPTSYMVNDLMVVVGSTFNNGTTTYDVGVLLTATTTSISYSASHWTKKINDTEDLDAFVAVVNPKVDALKAQLDGSISYYFQLSTAALPSVAWTTDTLKNAHHGDLLYFTDTKVAKRYSAQSNAWYDAADMTEVLAKIAASQATADGKATVYYKTSTEINAITTAWTAQQKLDNVGDVWIDSGTSISKIWNTTAWVNVATVDANTALSKLADLEEARDGVVDTYYTTTAPVSGMSYGDYWVDTDSWTGTVYVVYRYEALDGSSTGTIAWRVNTGETAVTLGKAYRADVAGSAAFTAQTTADTANTNATSALSKITDMASDNILSPVEKPSIIAEYSVITTEQSGIDSQATSYGITTEKTSYDIAVSALTTYLTTLTSPVAWNTLTCNTTIVGTTFRSKFNDVYTTRQTLLNAITSKAKLLADTAQGTADGKIKTWYQAAAPTGLTASDVGDIWVDTDAGNLTKTWSGTAWADIINTQSNTAYTWSANASKLITSPDGSVTGWSFGDGSNTKSNFKIKAENFSISDGTTGYTPFSIVGSDVNFNGKVTFSSISDSGTYIPTISSVTTAQSTANSKPNVYYQATAPSSVGRVLGDLWFDSDDKNQPYRWSGSAWVSIRDLSITDASTAASAANTAALNAMTAAQAAQATADGAIRTFYQASAPTGLNATTDIGDMWFDTDDNQAYRWNGSVWTVIEDNSIAVALAAAQNAQTTADGKITAFYQTGTPVTGMETGDIWYDTDDNNKVYYYTGAAWSTLRDGTIAIAQTAANSAQTTANTASTNATSALSQLTDIASDSILSPVEKPNVISTRDVIVAEQAGIDAQATTYSVTTEKTAYDVAISALTTYLATLTSPVLWSNVIGNTTIVGTTFRSKFNDVYITRQTLLNKISAKAKDIADAAALTADWSSVASRPTSLATLNSTDGAALSNAISAISAITDDNILSASEKSTVRKEWNTIVGEKAMIETQATSLGITTENTAYVAAIVSLGTYMNAGTAWTFSTTVIPTWIADAALSVNTAIVGTTFRTNFSTYYTARQTLVNKINAVIKATADSKLDASADIAALVNANTTTIDGAKITTGSISAASIASKSITSDYIASNTITADNIASNTITADNIASNTITADNILVNNIAVASAYDIGGYISAITAFGVDTTTSNTNSVGSFTVTNTSSVQMKVLIIGIGRSGVTGASSGYQAFGCWISGVKYFDFGWSPILEDMKGATFTYTIPANSSITVDVRGCKSVAYALSLVLKFSTFGVRN